MSKSDFKKLKEETERKYKKIKAVDSPALKSSVIFNSNGFHHLRYDNSRKERDKKIQRNKFIFFDEAVKVIKKSTTIQEHRRQYVKDNNPDRGGLCKVKLVQWFAFFVIISFSKQIRIKVIVRKVGEGQYHFWSVMPFWTLSNNVKVIGSKDIEDG